jgi:hypothetical protein
MTRRQPWRRLPLALAAATACCGASALEIDTGHPEWSVRFDNTVKLSTLYRTRSANPHLVDTTRELVPGVAASAFPQAANFNAGDDNFRSRGWVSKRIDLLSEFDAVYRQDFGFRLSAAGWYDQAYDGSTHAADTHNGQTPYNEFPAQTQSVAGHKTEVLDAFVFGSWSVAPGQKLSVRLGQHALQYGESLFFGENGIARAQGPIDIFKLLGSPNAQFKEIVMPVPQVSAQLQLSAKVSLGAYYQFRWAADRLPPAGSYFSTSNNVWGGSLYPEIVEDNLLFAGGDRKPKDSGQFGAQLRWRLEDTDLGFYYAQYHDKSGQLYGRLNPAVTLPNGFHPGEWYFLFPTNVRMAGASASHSIGDFNIAGEASLRDNMPLRSTNMLYAGLQPRPATGRTAHANLSTLATLGPSWIANESTLLAELAWNRLLSADDPDHVLDAGRSRDASALQFVYSPTYRQAAPGLDLSVPIGLRYTVDGHSSVTAWDAKGSGSFNIGLSGNYLGVWQFTMTYTRFIGAADPFVSYQPLLQNRAPMYGHGNPLADRDFVALALRRSF